MAYCYCGNGQEARVQTCWSYVNGAEKQINVLRCNSCASNINELFRSQKQEFRDQIRQAQEERDAHEKARKEQELKRRMNEHKCSHCYVCGKKSNFYHYIFNKITHKIEESWSNATDPENQIIFCNKEHFRGWLKAQIKKRRKIESSRQALQEEIEKLQNELEDVRNQETKCSQCSSTWKTGEKYYYSDKKNDGKKFCSSQCFWECYAECCDKCSKKIGMDEKSYYVDVKNESGTLCESCYKIKKEGEQSQSSDALETSYLKEEKKDNKPTSTNSPTLPNNSPRQDNLKSFQPRSPGNELQECWICRKSYSFSDDQKHFQESPSCGEAEKVFQEIDAGRKVDFSNYNLNFKSKITLEVIQDIKINKKWVDIDQLDLPYQVKQELKKMMKKLGIEKEIKNVKQNQEVSWIEKHGTKLLVGAGSVGGLTSLVVIFRRRRLKKSNKLMYFLLAISLLIPIVIFLNASTSSLEE